MAQEDPTDGGEVANDVEERDVADDDGFAEETEEELDDEDEDEESPGQH